MEQKILKEKEKIEIDFWKNDLHEKPSSTSIYNILNKCTQGIIFLEALEKLEENNFSFGNVSKALELGAGQGWASCILKTKYPNCNLFKLLDAICNTYFLLQLFFRYRD